MSNLVLAVTQMSCGSDPAENADRAEALVRQAVSEGANLVLLQELFESQYFCSEQNPKHFEMASPFEGNPLIARFAALAAELGVVLPISFFVGVEHVGCEMQFYGSSFVADETGAMLAELQSDTGIALARVNLEELGQRRAA